MNEPHEKTAQIGFEDAASLISPMVLNGDGVYGVDDGLVVIAFDEERETVTKICERDTHRRKCVLVGGAAAIAIANVIASMLTASNNPFHPALPYLGFAMLVSLCSAAGFDLFLEKPSRVLSNPTIMKREDREILARRLADRFSPHPSV